MLIILVVKPCTLSQYKFGRCEVQAYSFQKIVQIFSTGGTISQLVTSFSSQFAQVLDLISLALNFCIFSFLISLFFLSVVVLKLNFFCDFIPLMMLFLYSLLFFKGLDYLDL